jgi:hypothetical protein
MAIYRMSKQAITPLEQATFAGLGIHERKDMQRLLLDCVDVIAPATMILAEEYGDWVDSSRRIDLLALDKAGNLVVIELKRTEDGGHMELQAIRYAAMVSTMTLEQAVEAHRKYLNSKGLDTSDPEGAILKFLGSEEPAEFNTSVRIVLAAADFSKEITSSVLWLNEQGLDVTCVRMRPHKNGDEILLDVQQVIPLPEAAEFQVAIQQKASERRAIKRAGRDLTKYHLTIGGQEFQRLNKRRLILEIVRAAISRGMTPQQITAVVRIKSGYLFASREGNVGGDAFIDEATGEPLGRYFTDDGDLFRVNGTTYALTNQWGRSTEGCAKAIIEEMPEKANVKFEPIGADS